MTRTRNTKQGGAGRRAAWRRVALCAALLAPLCLAAPARADDEPTLLDRISDIGEQSRFVPDKALTQLLKLEPEARAADVLTKAEFLTQMSLTRGRLGQNDAALTLAAELVAYGRAVHSKAAEAKGMLCEGYIRFSLADVVQAHKLGLAAEPLALASGLPALQVQATITAGQVYAEQGNFPAAITRLQAAVDLARPLPDQLPLASALKALANLYDQLREYDKGFAALDELLAVGEKLQSPGRLALAKNTEYGLSIDAGQPRRALRALEESLVLERQLGAQRMIASTLVNLSDSYLKQRDYQRTLQYANQSLKVSRQSNDEATEATANVNIGEAYLGLGRIAEGKRSFEAGMAFYERANSQPDLQVVLVEYGQALERAGDLAGALAAYHRERDISNKMFEKQRRQSVLELQEKYETEKKQRQIELLRRENQVKGAEIDNRRLQQRVWWLLAVVFALAAVIVGLLYRKVRHANAQLEVKNEELKAQSALDPLTSLYNRRHFQDYMRSHNHVEKRDLEKRDAEKR
ncbi:tetratricopeptide repeat protein, partial [Rugamonas sp.]|uniref:tetratricopeptide repeat protein n=1 Tax=Rugamonas sp. TaxID=1926287 RepID=UPI0025F8343F